MLMRFCIRSEFALLLVVAIWMSLSEKVRAEDAIVTAVDGIAMVQLAGTTKFDRVAAVQYSRLSSGDSLFLGGGTLVYVDMRTQEVVRLQSPVSHAIPKVPTEKRSGLFGRLGSFVMDVVRPDPPIQVPGAVKGGWLFPDGQAYADSVPVRFNWLSDETPDYLVLFGSHGFEKLIEEPVAPYIHESRLAPGEYGWALLGRAGTKIEQGRFAVLDNDEVRAIIEEGMDEAPEAVRALPREQGEVLVAGSKWLIVN